MFKSCVFPDIPVELSNLLFKDDKSRVIIGVIGRSQNPDCNKMSCFEMFSEHVSFTEDPSECREGRIKFYFKPDDDILFVHFETTFDVYIAYKIISEASFEFFLSFNSILKTKFARMLLFATHVCHFILFVEPSNAFDNSYISIFKSLRVIREKYVLKFLPKLLKNSNVASFLGKEGRLCSPRFIFFFEDVREGLESDSEVFKYEIEYEDIIYKMLRNDFVITNSTFNSLFSIPRNKRFLYFNTNDKLRVDPIEESTKLLMQYIEDDDGLDEIRPYRGFAKNYHDDKDMKEYEEKPSRNFLDLIQEHVDEAIQFGFDDSLGRFKGKSHFVRPTVKSWYEAFKVLHKIFVENAENESFEPSDTDYKSYLQNFHKIMDIDEQFFYDATVRAYDSAMQCYKDRLPNFYSKESHSKKLEQALETYRRHAKGPEAESLEEKLKEECETFWTSGKQLCEYSSLRGNPCVKPKHVNQEPNLHSSGIIFVSTCNCGKTQGKREDPYTIRQANFEFYNLMAISCSSCSKVESTVAFPIFQPSINDFKAAEVFNRSHIEELISSESSEKTQSYDNSDHQPSLQLSGSQKSRTSENNFSLNEKDRKPTDSRKSSRSDKQEDEEEDDEDSMNEFVIQVGEIEKKEKTMRQVSSTTEYLPSMLNNASPEGLLPQFPSWSLVCVGPSSIYSHNSGLPEHAQSGFLSGTNFLLPWDVKVRLEHSKMWAENYEKTRNRKKHLQNQGDGTFFTLKIFIGNEYECGSGHRFIMSSPDTILRANSGGIIKDSGSKVVFNNMPLYFPCPCRQNDIGQLMRVHIVTPKAPVSIFISPKIKIPQKFGSLVFTSGLEEIKLSQSAYFILRLPYVYHGDEAPILPPAEVTPQNALQFGFLMEGMYGIKEDTDKENEINM